MSNLKLQYSDLSAKAIETQAQASQSIDQNARATGNAQGTATVSAGEAGVSGNSVRLVMDQFEADNDDASNAIYRNRASTLSQIQRQKLGAQAEAASQINSAPPANPLATALRIGGAGLNLATRLNSRKPTTSTD